MSNLVAFFYIYYNSERSMYFIIGKYLVLLDMALVLYNKKEKGKITSHLVLLR